MSFLKKMCKLILKSLLYGSLLFIIYSFLNFLKYLVTGEWNLDEWYTQGKYSNNRYGTIYDCLKECIFMGFFSSIFIFFKERKKIKYISTHITEYCDKFVSKFQYSLDDIPNSDDIKEFLKPTVEKKSIPLNLVHDLLIPIIIQKVKMVEDMTLFCKYKVFYKRNIKGINFGKLSTYDINEEEVNKLLLISNDLRYLLRANRYITIEVCRNISNQKNILNIEDNIDKNEKLLVMYFDTQLILQNIVTQAFLEYGKDNDIVKEDILKQIINSNETKQDKNKILINIIKINIIDDEKFKKVFFETVNNNKIILDIIQL